MFCVLTLWDAKEILLTQCSFCFFRSRRLAWLIMLHGSWNWSSFMKPKEFVTVWWLWDRVEPVRRSVSTCFANLSRNAACCTKRCEWILKQLLLLRCLVNLTWLPMTGRMVSFPLYGERLWKRKKWVLIVPSLFFTLSLLLRAVLPSFHFVWHLSDDHSTLLNKCATMFGTST